MDRTPGRQTVKCCPSKSRRRCIGLEPMVGKRINGQAGAIDGNGLANCDWAVFETSLNAKERAGIVGSMGRSSCQPAHDRDQPRKHGSDVITESSAVQEALGLDTLATACKTGSVRPVMPLTLLVLTAAACGSSFQATYECDVHFEHCYALDQTGASTDTKRQCWRDWLRGYTYAQSRDRIAYATTRVNQLASDQPPSGPVAAALSPAVAPTAAAPMPTNAFAPPPNVRESHPPPPAESMMDAGSGRDAASPRPGPGSAAACHGPW